MRIKFAAMALPILAFLLCPVLFGLKGCSTAHASSQLLFMAAVRAATTLDAPTGVSASSSPAQITATWSSVSGATSYNVYYGTASDGTARVKIASASTGTNYTIDGPLTGGTGYYIWVSANNVSGEGSLSSTYGPVTAAASASVVLNSTNFQFITGGTGTITGTGALTLTGLNDASQAALVYKTAITKTDKTYTVRTKALYDTTQIVVFDDGEGGLTYGDRGYLPISPIEVWDRATMPTVSQSSASTLRMFTISAAPITYDTPSTSTVYWDASGAIQQIAGLSQIPGGVDIDYSLITSATGWRLVSKSVDGLTTYSDSGVIAWSATRPNNNTMWLVLGNAFSDPNINIYDLISSFKVQ